jgi:hypothetical protein
MAASASPSINLQIIRPAKFLHAAKQASTVPQMITLTETYFARGKYCIRRVVGNSNINWPKKKILATQL